MKIKKIYLRPVLYVGLIMSVISVSCVKDLKNVSNPDAYTSSNYPGTLAQLKSVLGGVYGNLRTAGLWGYDMYGHTIYVMDHTADLGYPGDAFWSSLCVNAYTPSNVYVSSLWQYAYIGVQSANTFLSALDFYRANHATAGDSLELSYEEGEARFLRAVYYFYLINMYSQASLQSGTGGDMSGIPLITAAANSFTSTQIPASTIRQIWDQIINDLTIADQKLQKHEWDGGNIARVPGWAPLALLGKVYVFTGDYAKAKTTLKDVIENSGRSLTSFDTYKNMFNGENSYSSESLFEINVQRDFGALGIVGGPNITTQAGLIYAPTCMNVTDTAAVANGFGNEFLHDKNLQRFGFNLPIWNMVPNPQYNPSAPAGPYNVKNICDPDYVAQSQDLRTNKTVDPRLYVSALQPWVDSIYTDSGSVTVKRVVLRYKEINPSLQSQYYGWSLRKYAAISHSLFAVRYTDNANIILLRLADIYLLYAESCMNTGEDGTALEYINKVHRRAYGANPDAASAFDYTSLTGQTKTSDPVLGNNPLRYERWAELFGEGQWWFDVRRWNIGAQEAAYYQKTIPGAIAWKDISNYFPIPQLELDNNPQMKQYDGYK